MAKELNPSTPGGPDPAVSSGNQPEPAGEVVEERLLPAAKGRGSLLQVATVCGFLLLAVGLVFGQTADFEFIVLDDLSDVTMNPHVNEGLKADEVWWVFTHCYAAAWMPMTWISHMLDCELFGLNAGGHHLTNVVLHAATAVLLFLVLRQWTGRLWPSALVAAVFAIHPLRVESVAWVTERKDVLSGLFFMLTLWAYGSYVRRRFSIFRYSLVLACFALALMSKPMVVTVPFLLLLLDYWPLGRWTIPAAVSQAAGEEAPAANLPLRGRLRIASLLLLEKVPMLAMVAGSSIVTLQAYDVEGVAIFEQRYDLAWRVGNGLLSYVSYLGMFFYPVDLATPYPRPGLELPYGRIAGAAVLLVFFTLAAVAARRKYPYVFVGWFWYVGMLVPVSGILQFGMQAMADRFTYLPQIGMCMALVWALAEAFKRWRLRNTVYALGAAAILAVLMVRAYRQTSLWRNDHIFWNHALACNPRNWWAYYGLGNVHQGQGEFDKAIDYYRKAIALHADDPLVHYNFGVALACVGRLDEAIEAYKKTIELHPNHAVAKNNLGNTLLLRGHPEQALAYCREAIRLDPDFAEAHFNIGTILFLRGRADEAIREFQQAVAIKPEYPEAYYALGAVLAQHGRFDEAIDAFRKALESPSAFAADIHFALGNALVARDRSEEAATHFRKALELRPVFPAAEYQLKQVLAGKKRAD
ncbi:MAG: tetratricopeptide repeat protein [Planctomycetaceae bacterium]|nr:tetratricopeptide repeat protein [Planctomycetaceae bacterium]